MVLTDGGGGGGVAGDSQPIVSAGPDASGGEGSPIALRRQAYDPDGPSICPGSTRSWMSPKPAMSRTLADPATATTRITCNDEGTLGVTLTADDGVNPPVTDSATVTALNTPLSLELTSPVPWSVFRAGTPVALAAPDDDTPAPTRKHCRRRPRRSSQRPSSTWTPAR